MFRCVKFQESNDKTQLIFGSVTNIQATDAAPVEVNAGIFLEKLKIFVLYNLHNLKKNFFAFFFFFFQEDRHYAGPGKQWKPGAVYRGGAGK